MRRPSRILLLALAAVVAGCGGKFDLPTQSKTAPLVPSDKSYAMLQTWEGMNGIQDILLTQGTGSQLFMLFNELPGTGTGGPSVPRGEVRLYPFAQPREIGAPYFRHPTTLFNPVAISAAPGKLFVLDQGDTCMAKFDVVRGACDADPTPPLAPPAPQPRRNMIRDYSATWRVREFGLAGGDTISTFTDTTFAIVYGIAADNQYVYVSGVAALLDTSRINPQDRTRKFVSRIFRYGRGPRYAGNNPPDINMPGANWHRDTSWTAFDGTGASFISDPRGLAMSPSGSPSLAIADRGNNQGKTVLLQNNADNTLIPGVRFDGRETGSVFNSPEDIAADLQGYLYLVDRGNQRVLRYDPFGGYVQIVNVENNSSGLPLKDPITIGVDDSLAYVGDRGRGQVIRYKRRP